MLIQLCLRLLSYSGLSFRSCRHVVFELLILFELSGAPCPSHSTIRMWACKYGYSQKDRKSSQGQWVLIVDESVSLGENKVLLILGHRIDTWGFRRVLTGQDIELLHFATSPKWEGGDIAEAIKGCTEDMDVLYVVSDKGNNLMKSYKAAGLCHIPDCTHVLAKALEHYCKKNINAADLLKQCGELRKKWNMGKKTVYMPPSQLKKARFHNLSPIAKWAEQALHEMDSYPEEVKAQLEFLPTMGGSIEEFGWICKFISSMNKQLKQNRFSLKDHRKLKEMIRQKRKESKNMSSQSETFLTDIEQYLRFLKERLPIAPTLCCCSDIIESTFGKMKYRTSPNTPFGLGEFAFSLVSLGKPIDKKEVKKAMENTTEQTVSNWKTDNLAESLFSSYPQVSNKQKREAQ